MAGMRRRVPDLLLSALGWLGFNAVMLWTIVFLAAVVVPRTVDGPVRIAAGPAIAVDLALLLLFAAQHSVMARPSVKARLRRWVPERLERTTFVLATDVCLVLLLVLWQPWAGDVWRVDGVAAVLLWSLCGAGWLLAIVSTNAIDQLELTGLRQAGWAAPRPAEPDALKVDGLYAVVRHPLMTGLLVAFWATPRMSAPHLLFAAAATGYVLVGVHFEERDLRRTFGSAYAEYAARVPALVPGPVVRRKVLR
jgi:protein-S-isoprenylcysteine O-methyltransferase Ste14